MTTAWSFALGIGLMAWAFGWSGAKNLVADFASAAEEKQAEQKASRAAKTKAKYATPAAEGAAASEQTEPSGGSNTDEHSANTS